MISPTIAAAEIGRLDGTENFHMKSTAGLKELMDALAEHAETADEAHNAVSTWLEAERLCPTVADLRDLLRAGRESIPGPRVSYGVAGLLG